MVMVKINRVLFINHNQLIGDQANQGGVLHECTVCWSLTTNPNRHANECLNRDGVK